VRDMAVSAVEIAGAVGKHKSSVMRRAEKENWVFENGNGRGGNKKLYLIKGLPGDVQKKMIENMDHIASDIVPTLSPGAALAAYAKSGEVLEGALADSRAAQTSAWSDGAAISETVLTDPRVRRIAGIVQDALEVPAGWKKSKWIDAVAIKHDTTRPTIYKWIKKYKKGGLSGLQHTKPNKGKPKKWTPEAIDWWIGLCLKREHRKIAKDALYEILTAEAQKRGWNIGGYESALGWCKKKTTPQLLALQRGGYRALDNTLPPVLRSYADLAPFEILVGDQHRFDFWVMDDDTGEIFRPEGFFWQDLRSRLFYGGAVDKKYDSQLIGLALRIGCRLFGGFNAIYTDHGKPELSRYIMGIMAAVKSLGMSVERTVDGTTDDGRRTTDDGETINPCMILPGTHKKAIVRNAKAKMIEGTFNVFEGILRDHFKVPGSVKRLNASGEEQDIDQKEIDCLARSGKLLTFSEFAATMYKAMDYYNKEKVHRGVLKEWAWKPKPKTAVPMDCLRACFASGWRPRWLSSEDIDLVFLARADRGGRMVDRGRISFKNQLYEHDALERLHKTRVEVRYDCMDPEWVLCFKDGEFICRAVPVEYSSMKDQDLAGRKIAEKAVRRRASLKTYRDLTTNIPNFLNVSQIPMDERPEAVTGTPMQRKKIMENRVPKQTAEELAADVAMIENYRHRNKPLFSIPVDRYQWCIDQGSGISEEDRAFMEEYESRMGIDTRNYWEIYKSAASSAGNG
jgi:putative transposase